MWLVRHLNKKSGESNALYRGGGSIGIIGAARTGLVIAKAPEEMNRRVLAVTKCNVAREAPSMAFAIETAPSGTSVVEWLGECETSAGDLLAPTAGPRRDRGGGARLVRAHGQACWR